MKSVRTLRRLPIFVAVLVFLLLPTIVWAGGQSEGTMKAKPKVTFYWALYDGLTEDFCTGCFSHGTILATEMDTRNGLPVRAPSVFGPERFLPVWALLTRERRRQLLRR